MFESAIKLIHEKELLDQFEMRIKAVVRNSVDSGYGFDDLLEELYEI